MYTLMSRALLCLMCLTISGLIACKGSKKPDVAPVETSTEATSKESPPSKLEQADWENPPPGMPEQKP